MPEQFPPCKRHSWKYIPRTRGVNRKRLACITCLLQHSIIRYQDDPTNPHKSPITYVHDPTLPIGITVTIPGWKEVKPD